MISLFLDTSTSKLIVGVYKNTEEIYFESIDSNNDLSRKVLPSIDKALNSVDLNINEINNIYVVNGPGSFTGIRVGVTIAKTLAWSLNKKIYTISSLELLSTTTITTKYIIPVIDARRNCFFAGMYDSSGKQIFEDCYISRDDLIEKIERYNKLNDITFVSYDDIDFDNLIKPEVNISRLIEKYMRTDSAVPHTVKPNYLKRTEAEEKLDDKRN